MQKKKTDLTINKIMGIIVGAALIICFVIGIIYQYHKKKQDDDSLSSTTTETSTTAPSYAMDTEPILLNDSENPYQSLYGTGAVTLSDEEFSDVCQTFFYGKSIADSSIVQDMLIQIRNALRSANPSGAYQTMINFGKQYSLSDNAQSRDLAILACDLAGMKDLPTLCQNEQYEDARTLIESFKDVECYLIGAMMTGRAYMFYLNSNSISLDSVLGVEGNGELLTTTDKKYEFASQYTDLTPSAIYRFQLQYNADISFYAYISTDTNGIHHILSVENQDGTTTSPIELKSGTETPLGSIEHGENYDMQNTPSETSTEIETLDNPSSNE